MPAISNRIATLKDLTQLEERRSSIQEELHAFTSADDLRAGVVFDDEVVAIAAKAIAKVPAARQS